MKKYWKDWMMKYLDDLKNKKRNKRNGGKKERKKEREKCWQWSHAKLLVPVISPKFNMELSYYLNRWPLITVSGLRPVKKAGKRKEIDRKNERRKLMKKKRKNYKKKGRERGMKEWKKRERVREREREEIIMKKKV